MIMPQLLRDEFHEIHHVFGLAAEVFPQLRPLGGNAHRAGVEIAHAHHDAAEAHQRRGGKAEFLCAQHAGDGHVAAGHELAVGLEAHAAAQAVGDEALVRLGQAELPGQAGVIDGASGRGAGSAVVAGDEDRLRARLGDARGDGADARLGDELDGDLRVFSWRI